jgi:uncharacterized protein
MSGVGTRVLIMLALGAALAGCGSTAAHERPPAAPALLSFAYDAAVPLAYVDRGRVNSRAVAVAIRDISFRSGRRRIDGYLLLPTAVGRRPAVVLVHGSPGDRNQLLAPAAQLAVRGIVALTITEPSMSQPAPSGSSVADTLRWLRDEQVQDVVAIRRAVDLLRSLPQVDPARIGYLGWSAGARTGTFVAATDRRVKALVLLSVGAPPLSAYVARAPVGLRDIVRRVLGSVDPIRYIAAATPGRVLLEDGRRDEVVPRAALLDIIGAAPPETTVRWFDAPHALNRAAYEAAFDWLARKLAAG